MKKVFPMLAFMVIALFSATANATVIERYVDLTFSSSQISDDGSYGNGVFWRPTFAIDPFELTAPGDTVSVTVSILGGKIAVIAGVDEQESVFSLVGNPGGQRTFYEASWEFLNPTGDIFSSSLLLTSNSEGAGIAANFNPVDLTDSAFSFNRIRYSFTILDDPRSSGLPAVFDTGVVAVQTQGGITFVPVPEPSTGALVIFALTLIVFPWRYPLKRRGKWTRNGDHMKRLPHTC